MALCSVKPSFDKLEDLEGIYSERAQDENASIFVERYPTDKLPASEKQEDGTVSTSVIVLTELEGKYELHFSERVYREGDLHK